MSLADFDVAVGTPFVRVGGAHGSLARARVVGSYHGADPLGDLCIVLEVYDRACSVRATTLTGRHAGRESVTRMPSPLEIARGYAHWNRPIDAMHCTMLAAGLPRVPPEPDPEQDRCACGRAIEPDEEGCKGCRLVAKLGPLLPWAKRKLYAQRDEVVNEYARCVGLLEGAVEIARPKNPHLPGVPDYEDVVRVLLRAEDVEYEHWGDTPVTSVLVAAAANVLGIGDEEVYDLHDGERGQKR